MRNALKDNPKYHHMKEIVGCEMVEFKSHLESKFKEGMSWDNYGKVKGKWSIDHIMPCASFDFTKPEEQHACFHYTNTQPLWVEENGVKGIKMLWPDLSLADR